MTIAEKLTTVAENQQKVYEAGQKSMVDESKIIKKTATGARVVCLDDVSEIPHKIPVRLSSKNLLPYPYRETTKKSNGVTFTDNGDGSITVNTDEGGATASTNFYIINSNIPSVRFEYENTYILSGCPKGGSENTYAMFGSDGVNTVFDYGKSGVIIGNNISNLQYLVIRIYEGAVCNNLTFYPQIEVGLTDKNLIPYPYTFVNGVTKYGVTFTDNGDGGITLNGTPTQWFSFPFYVDENALVTPDIGRYIVSCNSVSGDGLSLMAGNKKKLDAGEAHIVFSTASLPVTFELKENLNSWKFSVNEKRTYDNVTLYPKIQKVSEATSYTPFVPNDTEVTVKSCGKNLYNINNARPYNGAITLGENQFTYKGSYYVQLNLTLPPDRYSMSWDYETDSDITPFWRVRYSDGTFSEFLENGKSILVEGKNITNILLYGESTATVHTITYKKVQLEQGFKTEYEAFKGETIITTPAEGAELTSIAPNMNIMTDIDVLLEVDYHKSYGMQTEYDRFWDAYQENGNRTNYKYAFAGPAWSKETFKPKYDLVPVSGNNMFYSSNIGGDFVELLDNLGIKLDLSKVTGLSATFGYSYFTHLGIIDTSSSTTCYQMFVGCPYLVTIDKLILRTDGIQSFSNCFSECKSLENIVFEGVIGQNTFSMQWCTKLSKESIISAINALSTKTTGYAAPFSLVAVNTAFETSEGAADGSSSEEWETLVATKPNWIISLI